MASAREQMTMIESELTAVREQIERLRVQEDLLVSLLSKMRGTPIEVKQPRRRSPSVKPLVLDIMSIAAETGATSQEVDERVREKIPGVAKDTVGSILSRLKSEGALIYDSDRYYEKRFAPRPFDQHLRAVG
jgi:hypothetical protein